MSNFRVFNSSGEQLDMGIEFAFHCVENDMNCVAINNHDEIFEPNSRYANLDIFKVVDIKSNRVIVSDITNEEWPIVRKALQYDIFAKK